MFCLYSFYFPFYFLEISSCLGVQADLTSLCRPNWLWNYADNSWLCLPNSGILVMFVTFLFPICESELFCIKHISNKALFSVFNDYILRYTDFTLVFKLEAQTQDSFKESCVTYKWFSLYKHALPPKYKRLVSIAMFLVV